MIKIAICDDIPAICSDLENIILEFQEQSNTALLVEIFYSGENLINHIKNQQTFDLIFLDIELESINGIEVGKIIRQELEDFITKIIYISSKSQYDRKLFDVQPLHFLEKPLNKEKVIQDINLAIKMLGKENSLFSFQRGHEICKIPIKEILYFESINKKIKIVGLKETNYFYGKINNIVAEFANFRFMQPHRSYLVNYEHISLIKPGEIKMINEDIIPISQGKSKEIRLLHIFYTKEVLK